MDGLTIEALLTAAPEVAEPPAIEAEVMLAKQSTSETTRVGVDFEVTRHGVYHLEATDDGLKREWLCGPLTIAARTRNHDGGGWGVLLTWKDADGRHHEWAMPASLLGGDGLAIREHLLNHGLRLGQGRKARERLLAYLGNTPDTTALAVQRVGWHGAAFVLPDGTIGGQGERVLYQVADAPAHAYREAGTLDAWKDAIGRPCLGNSRLSFVVALAFAAPLLELVGEEPGGFNLRGGSSTGKTTALRVAASVWGGGTAPAFIQRWRATANGLEAVAELHNDALLILDELGQIDPREAGEAAYMLANGAGKLRAARSGGARRKAAWRLLFLSAGEIGLGQHMRAGGKQVRAGQEVRLADVPMDAGAGLGGFEDLHGAPSADAFARSLNDAAGRFYGTPIRAFLAKLVTQDRDDAARAAGALKAHFLAEHVEAGASGEVSRVAGRFALVAAAGEMAAEAGILPWPAGASLAAVSCCFRAWLAERGGVTAGDLEAGIAAVRRFIEQHGSSRFEPIDQDGVSQRIGATINRAGFRREHPDRASVTEFLILLDTFRDEVAAGFDAKLIVRELMKRGHIAPGSEGKPSDKVRHAELRRPRVYRVQSSILEG